jgi:hypothetical protein
MAVSHAVNHKKESGRTERTAALDREANLGGSRIVSHTPGVRTQVRQDREYVD